jgi:hypothetical protein
MWIIGSSLIVHAEKRTNGRHNLGLNILDYSLIWAGMSGMHWDALVTTVHAMLRCFGIPKIVILHCGGNDISDVSCGNLLFHLKFALFTNSKMLPGSMVCYSNILPRLHYRYSNNSKAMERTRKRINRGVPSFLSKHISYSIAHPDVDDGHSALLKDGGVHLSFLGNDLFINTLKEAICQFVLNILT